MEACGPTTESGGIQVSVAIIGVAGTALAAGTAAYSQHQASKAADKRQQSAIAASHDNFGQKPKAAQYIPVDFNTGQIEAIMGNQHALGAINPLMSGTNAAIDSDALARASKFIPGYKESMQRQGMAAQDLLGGQLPYDDVLDIVANRSGLAGSMGTPGASAPATLRDLGLSRLDAIKSGSGLLQGMVNIAQTVNPVQNRMKPQDMFMNPTDRIRMAMDQNQTIQQSTQSKYNLDAGLSPSDQIAAQTRYSMAMGAGPQGGEGVDWASIAGNVAPQLVADAKERYKNTHDYSAAVPRLVGANANKWGYTPSAGFARNSIPAK